MFKARPFNISRVHPSFKRFCLSYMRRLLPWLKGNCKCVFSVHSIVRLSREGEIPGRADAFPSSRAPLPTLSSSALKGSHSAAAAAAAAAAEKEEGSSFAVVSGQLSEIHACSPARSPARRSPPTNSCVVCDGFWARN